MTRRPVASLVGAAGGASARGASHIARNKPNQDAIGWDQRRLWTYIAIADGHGSAAHYRSDRGARFAVETIIEVMREASDQGAARDPSALTQRVPGFAAALTTGWLKRVEADLAVDPVEERAGPEAHAVYGATCLGAAVGPGVALFAQIGDGDIFAMTPSGAIERPLPGDELVGEQTYSLCLPDAAEHVHVAAFYAPNPLCAPAFVFMATDGFAKSFDNEAAVVDVVRQYGAQVAARGLAAVVAELEPWLARCSQMGSGDDTSVVMFAADDRTPAQASEVAPEGARASTPREAPRHARRRQTALVAIVTAALVGAAIGVGATWAWLRTQTAWPRLGESSAAPGVPALPAPVSSPPVAPPEKSDRPQIQPEKSKQGPAPGDVPASAPQPRNPVPPSPVPSAPVAPPEKSDRPQIQPEKSQPAPPPGDVQSSPPQPRKEPEQRKEPEPTER